MGKYDPLGRYLSGQPNDSCTLPFPEVEEIIGGPLPASARAHQGWWGNDETHVQAHSWMHVGWKVTQHNLLRRGHVHFTRIVHATLSDESPQVSQVIVRNLDQRVVAELKRRAKQKGRSLEGELRVLLTEAARPQRTELIAEADRVRAMTPGPLEDSVLLLRQDRDSR